MSKTNKPARTRLKVVKKPIPSFPYEVGSEIGKPPYIRAIEWVHGGNLHTRLFQDLINDGYLKDVTDYPEPTLKSITEDYDNYGYLEDYQVKWLLNHIDEYYSLLNMLNLKISECPGHWTVEMEILPSDVETVVEKLKNIEQ